MIALLLAASAPEAPMRVHNQVKWVCDGPKFDSSCSPSSGMGGCHVFFGNLQSGAKVKAPRPRDIPPSYADNGRIAYCDWNKASEPFEPSK